MPGDVIRLTDLRVRCIIGIFPWERRRLQTVSLDLEIPCDARRAAASDRVQDTVDYKAVAKEALAFTRASRFHLLETLAEELSERLLDRFGLAEIRLTASKPGAVRGSRNVGVSVVRRAPRRGAVALLGFGSNVDPLPHFVRALEHLAARLPLRALSHVYETEPVVRRHQPSFWNLAAAVDAKEPLAKLHRFLRKLETREGRRRTKDRFAPRTLDVDLLALEGVEGETGRQARSHPDLTRRGFALFPALEIAPRFSPSGAGGSLVELAARLSDRRRIRRLPPDTLPGFPPFGSL